MKFCFFFILIGVIAIDSRLVRLKKVHLKLQEQTKLLKDISIWLARADHSRTHTAKAEEELATDFRSP